MHKDILVFDDLPNYKFKIFAIFIFLFWMVVFFGVIGFLFAAVFSYFIFNLKGCVVIDYQNKRYKSSYRLNNLLLGTWKKMPEIKYISLFGVKEVGGVRSMSNRKVSVENKWVKVNLIYERNKKITAFKSKDPQESIDVAKNIADKLDLRIYDAITNNRKWLD